MIYPLVTRKISRVFLHCSASDNPSHDDISVMRKWHLERGFNDVGYHHFIKKDGTIQNGRPIDKVPAAQQGHNTGTLAICLHGLDKDLFTTAQVSALFKLCAAINDAYDVTFHGHREVSAKSCPVIDYVGILNLSASGKMMR